MAQFRLLFVVAVLVLALCQFSDAGRIRIQSNRVKRGKESWIKDESNPPPKTVADDIGYLTSDLQCIEDQQDYVCIDVLANDEDSTPESFEIVSVATHGFSVKQEGNLLCYLPHPDFHGHDRFLYEVCDAQDQCEVGLVRVWVSPRNDAPHAEDDSVTIHDDQYSVVVDVLANDYDVDGRYVRRSSFKVVVPPKYGRYFVTPDKKIKYIPIFNEKVRFVGYDELTYEICDNERASLCSHATLKINVRPKCLACEKCADRVPGFNLHVDRVHHFYDQDVLSVKH